MTQDPSLVIIGGGSAGLYAALKADRLGARVILIEGADIGGTCPNRGCLPTKHLVTAAERYFYGQSDAFRGVVPLGSHLDFAKVMSEKEAVIRYARKEKYEMIAAHPKIRLIQARARLASEEKVEVDGRLISADRILLATGSSPILPEIPGLPEAAPLTSDSVQTLTMLPKRLVVIGGGEIGLEYGQLFLHFGVEVILLEKEERILPREEAEISEALRRYLEEEGMEIHTGVEVSEVGRLDDPALRRVRVQRGNQALYFDTPAIFVACGRRPNTADLGLEPLGIGLKPNGAVAVDPNFRTSVSNIFAAGDLLGHTRMLSSIADREGEIAVENALRGTEHTMDYRGIPYAILTSPQVASVGIKEEEAGRDGVQVETITLRLPEELPKATADRGLVKLVVEKGSNRILGVHLLAAKAAEAIHEAIFIVKGKLTVAEVCRTVHVYPTVAESILRAVEAYQEKAA
jgi:mercuric reductase